MSRRSWHALAHALLLLVLASTGALASPQLQSSRFESGRATVTLYSMDPGGKGRHPAVIILHGSGGLKGNATWLRAYARTLTARGYVVFAPAYLESTGMQSTSLLKTWLNFPVWLQVVRDCVSTVARDPRVDAERVGMLGLSLGSFLALSEAGGDPRVKCVVEYFGGLPAAYAKGAATMPPVLILHGDRDAVVSVAEADKLRKALAEQHRVFECHIYEGQGHGFHGAAASDAQRRTLRFLQVHLR